MKKIFVFAVAAMGMGDAIAQNVGVGTALPKAMLDVTASNASIPSNTDGLLIPRVNNFPVINPTAAQQGMMIYLVLTSGSNLPGFYFWENTSVTWKPVGEGKFWTTTGNANTNAAANFIGTTDNNDLIFKRNNISAGRLGLVTAAFGVNALSASNTGNYNHAFGAEALSLNSSGFANTAVGFQALTDNTTGSNNTATGRTVLAFNTIGSGNTANGSNAMLLNTSGNNNTAVGSSALYVNSTGFSNTAIGSSALLLNSTRSNLVAIGDSALLHNGLSVINSYDATQNTAVGSKSLYSNTRGYSNTAHGYQAMYSNTSGTENSATGDLSLYSNDIGHENVSNGFIAMYNNTSGYQNTAIGAIALYGNTTGYRNCACGYQALYSNQSGFANVGIGYNALFANNSGSRNIAIGDQVLVSNTIGNFNIANGVFAMTDNISGSGNLALGTNSLTANLSGNDNVALGNQALSSNTIGSYNIAIGKSAYGNLGDGSYNTFVGAYADMNVPNLLNATAIGSKAKVACSDCLILGSAFNAALGTANVSVGIGTSSPQTDLHVNPNGPGSILIGTNKTAGGYTNLEMGISQQSNGYSFIQSTNASGSTWGNLALNTSGGNVGIHMASPQALLHIKQSSETFPVNGGGLRLERSTNADHWDIGTDAGDDLNFTYNGAWRLWINNVDGSTNSSSDLRLKKDINLIGSVLPSVMLLQPKTYHYRDTKTAAPLSYGFIAQEVETLFPDFVKTKGIDSTKGITYQYFSVIAIKAIQEQQQQIAAAHEENKAMMDMIKIMQEEIELLKQKIK